MSIPTTFRAGTTAQWKVSLADHPAGGGWTVALLLNSGTQTYTVTADDSTGTYVFDVAAATSAEWVAGHYAHVIQASKDGGIYQPCQGSLTITAAFGATPAKLAQLTTDLASIDVAIRQVITSGGLKAHRISIQSVSDREYQFMDLAEMRRHRLWLLGEIERSKAELGLASKGSGYRRIKSVLS